LALGLPQASLAQSFVPPRSSLLSTEIGSHTSWKTADGQISMFSSAGRNDDPALFLSFSSHLYSSWDRHYARVRPTIGGEALFGENISIERRGGGCIAVRRQEAGITPPALTLCPQIEADHPWMEPFLGQWSTQSGILRLYRDRGVLRGEISRPDHNGVPQILRRLAFNTLTASELVGAWAPVHNEQGDRISLQLAPDGASFTGRIWRNGTQPDSWTGTKLRTADDPSNEPTSPDLPATDDPSLPTPVPPADGAPSSPPATDPATTSFKPLNRVDVRVDRVVVARGYPTHQVHAFVTVRNTSAVPQYFTSGFLKAVLADADGVSWERSQPYRASGEPAELFGSTPVIQPGGELRARFIFMPEDGAQLTSLTLSEGDKRAEFPVGGL
jgi:hypothetical protein